MILPNELRIGSWIMDAAPYDDIFQVRWSHIASIIENGSKYRPIPITNELLESCGFETPDGYQKTVLYNEIMIDYHMGEYKLRDKPNAQLKYLHQLQNIFYCLTGKELTITSFNQSN